MAEPDECLTMLIYYKHYFPILQVKFPDLNNLQAPVLQHYRSILNPEIHRPLSAIHAQFFPFSPNLTYSTFSFSFSAIVDLESSFYRFRLSFFFQLPARHPGDLVRYTILLVRISIGALNWSVRILYAYDPKFTVCYMLHTLFTRHDVRYQMLPVTVGEICSLTSDCAS